MFVTWQMFLKFLFSQWSANPLPYQVPSHQTQCLTINALELVTEVKPTGSELWRGSAMADVTWAVSLRRAGDGGLSALLCAAVGRSMHLCARSCQCVNALMFLSVSPSAWCTSTMTRCSLALALLDLQPSPISLVPLFHPSPWTPSFHSSIYFTFTSSQSEYAYVGLLYSRVYNILFCDLKCITFLTSICPFLGNQNCDLEFASTMC